MLNNIINQIAFFNLDLCIAFCRVVGLSNPNPFGNPIRPVGGNIVAHTSTYRVWLRKGTKGKRIAKMDDSPMHAQNEVVFESDVKGVVDADGS